VVCHSPLIANRGSGRRLAQAEAIQQVRGRLIYHRGHRGIQDKRKPPLLCFLCVLCGSIYLSFTITRRITSPRTMLSTTSMPRITRPKTVYPPSRCGWGECVANHCEPPVSLPDKAIPTAPRSYR